MSLCLFLDQPTWECCESLRKGGVYWISSHFLLSFLKSCCFWFPHCWAKEERKLKERVQHTWKVLLALSSELSVYHKSRYWLFCRCFNNEVSIIKSPICSSLLCLATYYSSSGHFIMKLPKSFLTGSFTTHYTIPNKNKTPEESPSNTARS